jgi:PAS domain S-box-containing protein
MDRTTMDELDAPGGAPVDLVRLRRQMRATARFAQLAMQNARLVDVLQAACEAACEGSGISRSKALILDPRDGQLTIAAGVGWEAGVIGMAVPVHGRSVVGPVLQRGESLVIDDLPGDERFDYHEPLRSHRIVSVVNVPIRTDESVLGVLELDSDHRIALSGDDVDFLQSVAGLIIPALMRARFQQVARQADERLRESEERLRVALRAARMGTWTWHLATDRHTVDDSLQQLLGLAPEQTVETHQDLLAAVHAADRAAVEAAFQRTLQEGADLDVEFRVVHRGGRVRWLQDQGRLFQDEAGRPLFLAGACVDVTDRKEAALRLQRADRVKTEFLAMLAHELRNPMAPLMNAVALLARGPDEPSRTGTALGIMRRQLTHLSRLVGDLLEVSRIEQGKIELRIEPVVLANAVQAAVETVQPMVEVRGQRLSVHTPPGRLSIPADGVRLTQVIGNLLHNAAKFTPEGGAIELEVEANDAEVAIAVRDDGMGISPEALPHVFGLFEQGDTQPLDRSGGGLGIGLALVRRLVELHGGSVEARSDGPGKGAEFVVRLRRHPPVGR